LNTSRFAPLIERWLPETNDEPPRAQGGIPVIPQRPTVMDFHINPGSRLPIYQQLAQQMREAVARGDLQPEDRLPSVRQLAQKLIANPNTIARAYTELEREGLLICRPGLGIFVAQPQTVLTKAAREQRLEEILDRWLTEAVHLGFTAEEVIGMATRRAQKFQWKSA
jgi:GntR family transcriptional regulator